MKPEWPSATLGAVFPTAALAPQSENIEPDGLVEGIEPSKAVTADTLTESVAEIGTTEMVQYRLTQQAILADFGLEALRGRPLPELEQLATQMTAEGMRTSLCKLLAYLPDENVLLVCAGVGWRPGVVGHARIGADIESPSGYALRTGNPVLSNHLEREERFRTPQLMVEHGVRRAINVLVVAHGRPWGVLEVDSRDDGRFDVADIPFLQGFANLLGVAIERHRAEEGLREALQHQRLLVRESSHRAKNSLALVSSLLNIQSQGAQSGEVRAALNEASSRIMTIAKAHDLLWQSEAAGELDVGLLVERLCTELQHQLAGVILRSRTDSIVIDAERAIAAGLLVTELATNAAKHAYDEPGGEVFITCATAADSFTVSVADQGKGLPPDFQVEGGDGSFGMIMINSLAQQIGGSVEVESGNGTRFSVTGRL